MEYTFYKQYDLKESDCFVMDSTQNSLFQCSTWSKVKDNWDSFHTCVLCDGKIVASALVLSRRLILGTKLFYIPRGPIMDYSNKELVSYYLEELKKLAKQEKAVAIRFDPSVLVRKYPYQNRNDNMPLENEEIISFLKGLGASHKGFTIQIEESTQPRFNAEMDVYEGYENDLEHRTRKCIRGALKKGIELREGIEYVHDFSTMMHYTEVRKKVALRGEEYFHKMLEAYGDKGICMIAVLPFQKQIQAYQERLLSYEKELTQNPTKKRKAELERLLQQETKELEELQKQYEKEGKEEIVTAGILGCYNDTLMELFYMGNHPDYLKTYSSYLLYKACLDKCVSLGITHCSFGGIEGTLDDGLTLFKSNWIMNVEEYIGEFNIILNPVIYTLFDSIYPKVLKFVAKVRGNS